MRGASNLGASTTRCWFRSSASSATGTRPLLTYTHVGDIGRYVARVVADPRTVDKSVFAYSEVFTPEGVFATVERLSGEALKRGYGRGGVVGWAVSGELISTYRRRVLLGNAPSATLPWRAYTDGLI